MTQLKNEANIFEISTYIDQRGKLGIIEGNDIPFDIKRIYYLYGVPKDECRGVHGHKELQQFIICMSGQVNISIHNGEKQKDYLLNDPSKGLYIPSMNWRELKEFSKDAVVIVLASLPYDINDYYFDLEEFIQAAKKNKYL